MFKMSLLPAVAPASLASPFFCLYLFYISGSEMLF